MGQSTSAIARAKARRRNREHVKRAASSDITAEQELAMRRKARKCPLCGISMRNDGGQPDSKELDHIIPIGIGGTHTHGNVRIICRLCNQRRPKDGSDYAGPVTLWAQGPSPVKRPRKQHVRSSKACRKGLHPWVPENIMVHDGKKRCKACRLDYDNRRRPVNLKQCNCGLMFVASGNTFMCPDCIDKAAHKAAELHASGGMSWDQVAAEVGYKSGWGAAFAARRIGYTPHRPQAKPKTGPMCGCGEPVWRHGRCDGCMWRNAMVAIAVRRGQGWTLRMIADWLGYDSITSVTNLMRQVGVVDSRYSRPPRMNA
jgi:hypothetical protein